jgi:hypothetical protein
VGADTNINVSKLQWWCVGIKIQLHIYIYIKMIKNNAGQCGYVNPEVVDIHVFLVPNG